MCLVAPDELNSRAMADREACASPHDHDELEGLVRSSCCFPIFLVRKITVHAMFRTPGRTGFADWGRA